MMSTATEKQIQVLSTEEIEAINHLASHYDYPQAASIEALKVVQEHRGWVSDESLRAIARLIDMSPEELDSVATFYSLIFRSPVGKNVLMVCDGISCWMHGCDGLKDKLSEKLGIDYGETSADGAYTLLPVTCQGACDRAPVVLKNWQLHTHLDEQTVLKIVDDSAEARS